MDIGVCVEMPLSSLPFEQRIAKVSELGFTKAEMWFVDMSFKGTPDELAKIADDNGVTITNTVIGAPDGSVGGGLTDPSKRNEWLARAKMSIDYTKNANIAATIVCTGNVVDGMTGQQMTNSVIEGLKPTVELAEQAGVTLLLEPLNTMYDHDGYFVAGSDQGAEICRALKSDRMKMLFDCYHMQIMEGDLVKHIERNIDVIGHFHSAGVPGRNELYKGEINYPFVIEQIEKLGYTGTFGLEYKPTIDDVESLKKTMEYLGL